MVSKTGGRMGDLKINLSKMDFENLVNGKEVDKSVEIPDDEWGCDRPCNIKIILSDIGFGAMREAINWVEFKSKNKTER